MEDDTLILNAIRSFKREQRRNCRSNLLSSGEFGGVDELDGGDAQDDDAAIGIDLAVVAIVIVNVFCGGIHPGAEDDGGGVIRWRGR